MTVKQEANIRLPAEWEPQDGILLAWPHADSDWQPILDEINTVFIELCRNILRFESLLIATPEPKTVEKYLTEAGLDLSNIRIEKVLTNDTWCRDFGPITILRNGHPELLDYSFNGWGQKFPAERDNLVTKRLHEAGCFGATPREGIPLILEGGSIESDGTGTIITTTKCLLNRNRNPQLDKKQLEEILTKQLGAKRLHWIDHGFLAGDDTDSHIDTLARLCPNDTIIYTRCDDPQDEHYTELQKMKQQLQQLRTTSGNSYRLIPLPWPQPIYDEDQQRLPATYANYLVINDAVLVPTYQDSADQQALTAIAIAFPERKIIGIDCRPVIRQHGSLHCLTMQLPQGVLP